MLFIKVEFPNSGRNDVIDWHIGEKIGSNVFHHTHLNNVTTVQADCDELAYIKRHSTGLPFSDRRVQSWHGDMAKWIVANLILIGD